MRWVIVLITFVFFASFALAQYLTEGMLRLLDANKSK